MENFSGKIAVVTGGGTGMGRELVCQLIAAGAHVAMCDVSTENMDETAALAAPGSGQRLTSHLCDVSSEEQMLKFRDEVAEQHDTQHINLLFNNACIAQTGGQANVDKEGMNGRCRPHCPFPNRTRHILRQQSLGDGRVPFKCPYRTVGHLRR